VTIERRPGETREAWQARVARQRADDVKPGDLAQGYYDLTTRVAARMVRFARRLDRELPPLKSDVEIVR